MEPVPTKWEKNIPWLSTSAIFVDVFKAIPLEPWGSIWVNIGDKRGKSGGLLTIPQRFCIEMCDAGFHLMDHVIWAKESVRIDGTSVGQAMIEPAPRRLNGNGHEPFYRFVLDPKQAWSDTCAVRIPRRNVADVRYLPEELMTCHTSMEGRNLTNVWNIPTGQTRESHYAVFPPALIERPVAMTCPQEITEQGPKHRIIEMVPYEESRPFNAQWRIRRRRGSPHCPLALCQIHRPLGRRGRGWNQEFA